MRIGRVETASLNLKDAPAPPLGIYQSGRSLLHKTAIDTHPLSSAAIPVSGATILNCVSYQLAFPFFLELPTDRLCFFPMIVARPVKASSFFYWAGNDPQSAIAEFNFAIYKSGLDGRPSTPLLQFPGLVIPAFAGPTDVNITLLEIPQGLVWGMFHVPVIAGQSTLFLSHSPASQPMIMGKLPRYAGGGVLGVMGLSTPAVYNSAGVFPANPVLDFDEDITNPPVFGLTIT